MNIQLDIVPKGNVNRVALKLGENTVLFKEEQNDSSDYFPAGFTVIDEVDGENKFNQFVKDVFVNDLLTQNFKDLHFFCGGVKYEISKASIKFGNEFKDSSLIERQNDGYAEIKFYPKGKKVDIFHSEEFILVFSNKTIHLSHYDEKIKLIPFLNEGKSVSLF